MRTIYILSAITGSLILAFPLPILFVQVPIIANKISSVTRGDPSQLSAFLGEALILTFTVLVFFLTGVSMLTFALRKLSKLRKAEKLSRFTS
jgi:hypothetical protein